MITCIAMFWKPNCYLCSLLMMSELTPKSANKFPKFYYLQNFVVILPLNYFLEAANKF